MSNMNIDSILQRSLSKVNKQINKSLERLATGLKINNAGDDAAGLALSTGMNSRIRGLNQANSNIQTGINVLSIAGDSLNSIGSSLQKLKELSVQAANGLYSDSERAVLQAEADQIIEHIKQTKDSTKFNDIEHIKQTKDSTKFNDIKLLGDSSSQSAEIVLQIGDSTESSSSITLDTSLDITDISVDLSSGDAARESIDKIDAVLNEVNEKIAYVGANSNILESVVESNEIKIENLTDAKSIIMDTDIAKETSNLVHNQILADATTSLMVQNNNNEYQLMKILIGF